MLIDLLSDMSRLVSIGLLLLIPLCLIYKKAGMSPAWAFLVFIPLGLLFIFIQLAFVPWPNLKKSGELM